eukprot:c6851_g1_i1.p1 GENE.c6851_g1_i1~~c6851_g1_i1.p1  ORF type:complete len:356 (+),score=128.73 c6851_g1_i1:92-1159(+)
MTSAHSLFFLADDDDDDIIVEAEQKKVSDPFEEREREALLIKDPATRKRIFKEIERDRKKARAAGDTPAVETIEILAPPPATSPAIDNNDDDDIEVVEIGRALAPPHHKRTHFHHVVVPVAPIVVLPDDPDLQLINRTKLLARTLSQATDTDFTSLDTPSPTHQSSTAPASPNLISLTCTLMNDPSLNFAIRLDPKSKQTIGDILRDDPNTCTLPVLSHVTSKLHPFLPTTSRICDTKLLAGETLTLHTVLELTSPSLSKSQSTHSGNGGSGASSISAPSVKRTVLCFRHAGGVEKIAVDPNESLGEVFVRFCRRVGSERSKMRFDFDGDELEDTNTAKQLAMEDDDLIDVIPCN